MTTPTVLYFEDTPDNAAEILPALRNILSGIATVEEFVSSSESDESFDNRLESEIVRRQHDGKEIVLILSDADLSRIPQFKGLSDANVRKVSSALGIPAAFYSSNLTGLNFLKADQAGDGRILLDKSDVDNLAADVGALVHGFMTINSQLLALKDIAAGDRPKDSAALLARLLGRPELENRVRLFVSGDQRMGAELLSSPDHNVQRQATIFGTWIYDSLLKYPGLVVSDIAAASYLNISIDDFASPDVQELFYGARYDGPFVSQKRQLWWRDLLDDVLLEEDAEDGATFARSKLGRDISPCICSESGQAPAGFYCMITKLPVSEEYSVGGISWFPPGADLARIAMSKYDELAPWLGL